LKRTFFHFPGSLSVFFSPLTSTLQALHRPAFKLKRLSVLFNKGSRFSEESSPFFFSLAAKMIFFLAGQVRSFCYQGKGFPFDRFDRLHEPEHRAFFQFQGDVTPSDPLLSSSPPVKPEKYRFHSNSWFPVSVFSFSHRCSHLGTFFIIFFFPLSL